MKGIQGWFDLFQIIFSPEAFLSKMGFNLDAEDDYTKFLPPPPSIPLNQSVKIAKILPDTAASAIEHKIERIEQQLTQSHKNHIQDALKSDQFQKALLALMGMQKEKEAIDLTLKGFTVLKKSSELKSLKDTLFNFSNPLPSNCLTDGLSFEQFASVLELKELLLTFFYIEKQNLNSE